VRLEDKAGAVWLQIANKSMLMNQKAGQRLADECMSPEQQQVAEAIRRTRLPACWTAPKPNPAPCAPAQPHFKKPWREPMLKAYRDHVAERAALGIPPLPLDAKQVAD
jgi:hypothetical protein